MGSFAADSIIVKKWREHPPYSLKINNLSQFYLEKYESRRFLSSGYNWRLVMYPKGNEKDNGSGFVSMYMELDNTGFVSTPPTEVFANLMFFVYNKKENKYFTIQDVEVKRFNAFRTMWGLSQMLSLETFNDPENGFIFEGEQFNVCYTESAKGWGIEQFLSLVKLREAYLDLEEALSIEIEFEVVSVTKHSA